MPTTCSKCRRANPAGAAFCYYDGQLLNGHGAAVAVAGGRMAFTHPFVFPSGRQCRNFDELALACDEDWDEARGLLEQGHFERFLGGLGRADLARAARDAVRSADKDRGLDDLLDKLPTDVLHPPKLHVGTPDVNLGTLAVGSDRRFELRLSNRGMRLLRGTVVCEDAPWLSLGDGSNRRLFQFGGETAIPVSVVGQRLRAGNKPLEGRLLIDSNGGAMTVTVRVEVPVRPYPDGLFRGATTPRHIAEKAKVSPKEAAAYFENGAVDKWYKSNGWTYPVQGPSASGLGAVQQFFEALGLTPPPKVEVSTRALHLSGAAGERLDHVIQVATPEKRPVYAHAVSDQPWLKVGRPNLQGRTATIPLVVAEVPDRPGETLHAQVVVTANGNQRFPVSVSLAVAGRARAGRPAAVLALERAGDGIPLATAAVAAAPVAVPAGPPPGRKRSRFDEDDDDEAPRRTRPARPARAVPLKGGAAPVWAHLAPVGALLVALLALLVVDALRGRDKPPAPVTLGDDTIDPTPLIKVAFHDKDEPVQLAIGGSIKSGGPVEGDVIHALWEPSMRFGVVMEGGADEGKRLTRDDRGKTNNTVVLLDGVAARMATNEEAVGLSSDGLIWGEAPWRREDGKGEDGKGLVGLDYRGRWKDGQRDVEIPKDIAKGKGGGRKSVWVYPQQNVEVTQFVEVVAGAQSRKLDTCLVRYLIKNNDSREHRVGLRFLLDTFIGDNDGVPFTIPGDTDLCDTMKDLPAQADDGKIPVFIEALEKADLKSPGTVARLQLRLGGRIDPPDRVTIGAWPDPVLSKRDKRCLQEKTAWEVPLLPINTIKSVKRDATEGDSAVVMYWDARPVAAGAAREVGFAYGLGNVAADKDAAGRLGLSVAGNFKPRGEFTLVAQVNHPKPGEELTLDLPAGLSLADGEAKQRVREVEAGAARDISTVTWKIKAGGSEGDFTLKVTSSAGAAQALPVRIRSSGLLD